MRLCQRTGPQKTTNQPIGLFWREYSIFACGMMFLNGNNDFILNTAQLSKVLPTQEKMHLIDSVQSCAIRLVIKFFRFFEKYRTVL